MTNEAKITKALEYLFEKHDADCASTYGEPGYTAPARMILFANWNNVPKGLAEWLEKCGFELEWSDEWTIIDGNAWRTSPDSYGWEPRTMVTEGGDEITQDDEPGEWIDECAMTDKGQPARCLPSWFAEADLKEAGFELLSADNESGLHPGMNDDPAKTAVKAFDAGAQRVVFRKTEQSQFYTKWQCWIEQREGY